jgi:hypothetical protein
MERDGLVRRRELSGREAGLLRNVNTPEDLETISAASE